MEINTGDTAWVLVASAMVLIMTPGLALFYGGLSKRKSTLNMMMMSFISMGIAAALWVIYGYAVSFGNSGSAFIGEIGFSNLGSKVGELAANGTTYPIPLLAFAAFQLMFAVITPALISGSVADRTKFFTWAIFVAIWSTVVYFPVAHWVFDFGGTDSSGAGWLAALGVLDFAGGTAIHINAGAAGLALAFVLGPRLGWKGGSTRPHNIPLAMIGLGLLWFGWFGFNGGSALGANATAGLAILNTQVAASTGLIGWLFGQQLQGERPSAVGAASGAIAGLVAITPACAFVSPSGALAIGIIAGFVCAYAIQIKSKFGFDDSLDVVGLHLVAGFVGCLAIGFLGTKSVNEFGADGLFYGGGFELLGKQAIGAGAVTAFSFIVTFVIAKVLDLTLGFRIDEDHELEGVDLRAHGELAYEDLDSIEMGDENFDFANS
jgi:ammonium transporter, Amt family